MAAIDCTMENGDGESQWLITVGVDGGDEGPVVSLDELDHDLRLQQI